jgi:hypothetical protein
MVAIFGGFNVEFSRSGNFTVASKTKNAYQRGKASRRSGLRAGGYANRPRFCKCEIELAQEYRTLKTSQDGFSVGVRYHAFGDCAGDRRR